MDNLRGEIHFILTAEHNDLSLIPHGRSSPHKFSALHTCTVAQPLPPPKERFLEGGVPWETWEDSSLVIDVRRVRPWRPFVVWGQKSNVIGNSADVIKEKGSPYSTQGDLFLQVEASLNSGCVCKSKENPALGRWLVSVPTLGMNDQWKQASLGS